MPRGPHLCPLRSNIDYKPSRWGRGLLPWFMIGASPALPPGVGLQPGPCQELGRSWEGPQEALGPQVFTCGGSRRPQGGSPQGGPLPTLEGVGSNKLS